VDDPDSRVQIASTALDDLKGIWRLLRRFAAGGGAIPDDLLPASGATAGLAGQLVRFASVGALTTGVFGALFLLLTGPLGPMAATVIALSACAAANIALNRRVTFAQRGRKGRRRHYGAGLVAAALPLAFDVAVLLVLGSLGVVSVLGDLLALTVVNAVAAAARFVLLRRWVFR